MTIPEYSSTCTLFFPCLSSKVFPPDPPSGIGGLTRLMGACAKAIILRGCSDEMVPFRWSIQMTISFLFKMAGAKRPFGKNANLSVSNQLQLNACLVEMVGHWRRLFPPVRPFQNGMAATSSFFCRTGPKL